VIRGPFDEGRLLVAARVADEGAPGVKPTSTWLSRKRWQISPQHNAIPLALRDWIRTGDSGKESLCVWMERLSEEISARSNLNNTTEIHDRHAMRNVSCCGEIM
jgi:hypothetical protein